MLKEIKSNHDTMKPSQKREQAERIAARGILRFYREGKARFEARQAKGECLDQSFAALTDKWDASNPYSVTLAFHYAVAAFEPNEMMGKFSYSKASVERIAALAIQFEQETVNA